MKEGKEGFSGEYITDIGSGTSIPESNEEDKVESTFVTSASGEGARANLAAEGTSGSSVEAQQGATNEYYVAKPRRDNIRARIINE